MDSYELILPIYPFRSPFWLLWISLYRLPLVQNLLSVQDVRYKKTIIFFTLLACFPGHVCTQNVVEKKGNQRFLKLQFLYFIGMEAWRLYSSHTTLSKHGQFRKRLAFFTLASPSANPKKHTWFPSHTSACCNPFVYRLQNHVCNHLWHWYHIYPFRNHCWLLWIYLCKPIT